ncbi:OmpP1/FadL family transporter [Polycladidibacter stylochi]|uniref:OmpP1/FadL family transporter n=1 Tax=Polycladidibacter stylochi TaxID=1807766 RepID=UPI00082B09A3|nr:outer membrane protein transport protein [Pseudovibrio stylochi]
MSTSLKAKLLLVCSHATLGLLLVSTHAHGGAFALREQSAYYQGLSFAGNATASDSLSSMFWNPATMVEHKGMKSELVNTLINVNSDVNVNSARLDSRNAPLSAIPGAANEQPGDVGIPGWVAASYGTYQFNDRISLGLGVNAPFGLSTKPNINWSGQSYNRSSKVLSVNVNPAVAFKLTDELSLGVGLQLQYLQVRLKQAGGVFTNSINVELRGEDQDLGWGGTLGLLYKPFEGTQIGLGYRSPVAHDLDGWLLRGDSATFIHADLVLPEMVSLSLQQEINSKARLYGTFEWTNWSRFSAFKINNISGTQISALEFFYDDGFYAAIGGEYDFNDQWTVRAGVAREWSPINSGNRTARLPDSDRTWLSGGVSYNFNEKIGIDFGYTHIFPDESNIVLVPGHHDYNGVSIQGDVNASVDILSLAARYTF